MVVPIKNNFFLGGGGFPKQRAIVSFSFGQHVHFFEFQTMEWFGSDDDGEDDSDSDDEEDMDTDQWTRDIEEIFLLLNCYEKFALLYHMESVRH